MDRILRLTLLYDFYGELLTEKQKDIFAGYFLNDLSMQELGDNHSTSRQAVNDLLKRTEKLLEGYESKLRLVERHIVMMEKLDSLKQLLAEVQIEKGKRTQIDELVDEIQDGVD